MQKKRQSAAVVPEILFSSEVPQLSRLAAKNGYRKIAPGIYTTDTESPLDAVVLRSQNLWLILSKKYPGAVISHRSAFELTPTADGQVFLTMPGTSRIPEFKLPGLSIRPQPGAAPQSDDLPMMHGLYRSSDARAYLENFDFGRSSQGRLTRNLGADEIEHRLDRICSIYGEDELNRLRERSRELAPALGMEKPLERLEKRISAILGTHEVSVLSDSSAIARGLRLPYDAARVGRFEKLRDALLAHDFPPRRLPALSQRAQTYMAFFDAYFSNYIEGTEFEVHEARDVVLNGKILEERPEDSHDILRTFMLLSNRAEMKDTPQSADQAIQIMKRRHYACMQQRPEVSPGEFKDKVNRAGGTTFVLPDEVRGTLVQGFDLGMALTETMDRAAYMMFLVAEVHPFLDGNGRLARIMMNSELLSAEQTPVIIPTVYREDYILSLRRLSREDAPEAFIGMLDRAQELVSQIEFDDFDTVVDALDRCNAFEKDGCILRLPSELESDFDQEPGW